MAVIYRLTSTKTGEVIEGTAKELGERFGSADTKIYSAYNMHVRFMREWTIEKGEHQKFKLICERCGKEFESIYNNTKYCSRDCANRVNKKLKDAEMVTVANRPKVHEFEEEARKEGMRYGQMQEAETIQMLRDSGFWRRRMVAGR